MKNPDITYDPQLVETIRQGLEHYPKRLPSWLFYDELGDQLFREIMHLPEYYPTRHEYDILQDNKDSLLRHFRGTGDHFRLIELGPGDGLKTEVLLKHFVGQKADFTYVPVDISANALGMLTERLNTSVPDLRMEAVHGPYENVLSTLHRTPGKKVILFLGASIGNFTVEEAAQFVRKLARPLQPDDLVLIGLDLKKDPRVILEAYDDSRGLTASFNRNMLTRLNRELGAEFNPENFAHFPTYDPESGTTRSFLISTVEQSVKIDALGKEIGFGRWETLQTEVSQKYDMDMIQKMMAITGLRMVDTFCDADDYFCDVLVQQA